MLYELPTNQTGLLSMAQYVNEVTNGWFGLLILFMVWIILTLYLFNEVAGFTNQFVKCMMASMFIVTIMAILFYISGILHFGFLIAIIILLLGLVAWNYTKRDL